MCCPEWPALEASPVGTVRWITSAACWRVLSVFACRGFQAIAGGVLRPCAMRDGGGAAARAPWSLACRRDQSL